MTEAQKAFQKQVAQSAANYLGDLQSLIANDDGSLTAIVAYHRGISFILDFSAQGELVGIHESEGPTLIDHGVNSSIFQVLKAQIDLDRGKYAVEEAASVSDPEASEAEAVASEADTEATELEDAAQSESESSPNLLPLWGTEPGQSCSSDGCCGFQPESEVDLDSAGEESSEAESNAETEAEESASSSLVFELYNGGFFMLHGAWSAEDDVYIKAEPQIRYAITGSLRNGETLSMEIEWNGADSFYVSTVHGAARIDVSNEDICMVGDLDRDSIIWCPVPIEDDLED